MNALGICLLTLAALGAPDRYDPTLHVGFVKRSLATVESTVRGLESGSVELATGVRRLGATLGQHRRLQAQLTQHLPGAKESGPVLDGILIAGLFDAYLSALLLELDGTDPDAGAKADSVHRLLTQALP